MPLITTAPAIKSNPTSGYLAVNAAMLRRLSHSKVDLFVRYDPRGSPMLYHRAYCPLEPGQVDKLMQAAINHIYVRADDFEVFGTHLLQAVEALAEHELIPTAERFAALQDAVAIEIEHVSRLTHCGRFVSVAEKIGAELCHLLTTNHVLPRELFRLARHDFNTFAHVTNVAGYAVILADHMGLCDEDGLAQIATAAILHDIGKRFIPLNILTKRAKLSSEERAIIETHPQRGYEELCDQSELSFEQLMMVYQHHERVDGKGYPVGLYGDEIHPWARMLSVVDVFDAMTAMRPYRRPTSVQAAMTYIVQRASTHFDPEAVECWNDAMNEA